MPRDLIERCLPDSIHEFQLAARNRYDDGYALARAGRRTGAIYLWGYAIEMTIKAAFFRTIGFPLDRPITFVDLKAAMTRGVQNYGILWPYAGWGHRLGPWAELLIAEKAQGRVGYAQDLEGQISTRSQRVYRFWRETLRYHKNVAYLYELNAVRADATWFISNSADL